MMRLQKFLAMAGVASRRKSEELISQGKIKVNCAIVKELGTQIDEAKDKIEYGAKVIKIQDEKIYIALNKPVNYISTTTNRQGKSVLELVPKIQRVYPVGRLDKDSRGLIILTNDGDLAYELTQAKFEYEKEYEVQLDKGFTQTAKRALEKGMTIEGKKVRGIGVKILNSRTLQLTLKEGINRQIRKMLGQLDYDVLDLKRIRIAKLRLSGLNIKEGEWKRVAKSDII